MAKLEIPIAFDMRNVREVARLIVAARAHVERAKSKRGMASPNECYEPTMAELWRALDACDFMTPRHGGASIGYAPGDQPGEDDHGE